jgi:predicted nucleic acid-binding protein
MSDKCFVDTNILVYAHDRSAGIKHQRAASVLEQLWQAENGVLSTQVLQEFCFSVRRKLVRPLSLDDTSRVVRQYLAWEIVINAPGSVLDAMETEARYRVSFWDALILNAAERAGAATLYSEDFSNGQRYGSVRVVNPLLDSPR